MAKKLLALLPKKTASGQFSSVWIWNSLLLIPEITQQLNQLKEKGFSTVIIKPAQEMQPQYLSEEFFAILNQTLELASKLSIQVKIAENIAGGFKNFSSYFTAKSEESRLKILEYIEDSTLRSSKEFSRHLQNSKDAFIYALRSRNGEIDPSSVKKLTSFIKDDHLSWKAPHGEWTVSFFKITDQYLPLTGYQIDYYNSKTMSRYCSELFTTYKTNISAKYWEKVFTGFVFELPYLGISSKEIPFSESFKLKFRSKFKQDFERIIPLLMNYGGSKTGMLRNQVYSFFQTLCEETFLLPLDKTNKKFKLQSEYYFTSISPFYSSDSLLNIPKVNKAFTFHGCVTGKTNAVENSAVLKLLTRELGKKKVPFRMFLGRNGSSSSSTLQELKTEIDKSILAGVKNWLFDGMAYYPSVLNHPLVPNNPFYYSPSWNYLDHLIRYSKTFADLTSLLSPVKKVLMVYPRAALYAAYSFTNQTEYNRISSIINECSDLCEKLAIDYDVVEEEELLNISLKKNKIFLSDKDSPGEYDVLLMPRVIMISRKTIPVIKQIISHEVPILWVNGLPASTCEEGISVNLRKQIETWRKKNSSVMKFFETVPAAENDLQQHCSSPVKVLSSGKPVDEMTIVPYHGKYQGFVIMNRSSLATKNVNISIDSKEKLYLADCDKQEVYRFPKAEQSEKGYQFNFDFQPREILFLLATKNTLPVTKGHLFESIAGLERKYRIVFKNKWNFKPDQVNILPLSLWNMRITGSRENNGFIRFYESYFEAEENLPKSIQLVLNKIMNQSTDGESPLCKHVEISINGIKLKDFQPRSFYGENAWTPKGRHYDKKLIFGPETFSVDITDMVRTGFNRIMIRSIGNYYTPLSILYPLLLTGGFSLKRGTRGWVLCNEASVQEYNSWAEYGYPYYSGNGTYTQTFERPDSFKRLIIKFKKVEEIATLKINGQSVAIFPYEPMEVDVTNFTFQGKNEISIQVCNTIDNMTKLNLRPSGLVGEVYLDVY
jgi:hypothetical protein